MIACDATLSVDVTQVATLAAIVCVAQVPMFAPVSLNDTVPVGEPAPGAVTEMMAVKVTDCPNTDGLVPDTSATVVAAPLTTWLTVFDVGEPLKLLSPL